jgi:hypothetical protein
MSGKYAVFLTRSQLMALIDLIAHSIRCRCDSRIEQYIDASNDVVTTPGELLRLISDAPHFADRDLTAFTKARVS